MQAIPVFAMSESKTVSVYFSCGDNAVPMYIESDDVKVPLYVYYTGVDNNMYLNGIIQMSKPNFTFKLNNNSVIAYSYFEPDLSDGLQFVFPAENDNVCKLYFDNHNSYAGIGNLHIVGYFHFSVTSSTQYTIEPTFNNIQALISYQNVTQNESPLGFADAMIEAINSSSNVDEMLTLLDKIGGDSGYLPEILSTMQTNHAALYNLINSVWLTDQSVLSVSQQTYNTVLSILNILNHIDNNLDIISWTSINSTFDLSGSSLTSLNNNLNSSNPLYMKFSTDTYYGLLHLRVNIRSQSSGTRNSFTPIFIGRDTINNLINESEIYIYSISSAYVDIYINNFIYGDLYIGLKNEFDKNINIVSYNVSRSEYINSNDIEYWQILSALRSGKIASILSNQYSSQVNQADAIKDEVDTNLQNLADDIIVEKPSAVANIADDYIEQVDTSHNYQVFSWLTAPTFVLMMSIVAGLAVISYMLYGGQ